MKVKSEREVAQSCLTLSNPVDRSLPGSSVHGIFQARVLEWVAIAFSVTMVILLEILSHFPFCLISLLPLKTFLSFIVPSLLLLLSRFSSV